MNYTKFKLFEYNTGCLLFVSEFIGHTVVPAITFYAHAPNDQWIFPVTIKIRCMHNEHHDQNEK
jgi:hypothetical protein